MLANGFLKNIRNCSKYHHMDPKFPGNGDFRKKKKIVWLRAVFACEESNFLRISPPKRIVKQNQMAMIHEIKKWQKISWHCPFNIHWTYRFFWCSCYLFFYDTALLQVIVVENCEHKFSNSKKYNFNERRQRQLQRVNEKRKLSNK